MQAENFISKVELEQGDLPPVLDIEQLNGTNSTVLKKEAKRWLETVETYYNNVKPIIYTNVGFMTAISEGILTTIHGLHTIINPNNQESVADGYSGSTAMKATVNGIVNAVDFNVFNGDSLDFRNLLVR